MHRAGLLVNAVLLPDGLGNGLNVTLPYPRRRGKLQGVNLFHQRAKHTALSAACSDNARCGFFLNPLHRPAAGFDRCRPHVPIDGDGFDGTEIRHQPLVAQVAQHQPFGMTAQCHERNQLFFIQIHRQRSFGRNGQYSTLTVLVQHGYLTSQGCLCRTQTRAQGGLLNLGIKQRSHDHPLKKPLEAA